MNTRLPLRRDRAAAHARKEILDAAALSFARDGFRGTTMNDIATAAGCTPPTLYAYFRSKEAIYDALLASVSSDFLASFDEPMPRGLDFRQKLELLLTRQLRQSDLRPELLSIFFASLGQDGGLERYAGRLESWLRAEMQEVQETPATELAIAISGVVYAFVRRAREARRPNPEDRAAAIARFVLDGAAKQIEGKEELIR